MAPRLPDRYELEVRLGADGDIEEWLATDKHLDRPVMLRFLPPATPQDRCETFLDSVRSAARVSHTHIATVYAAGMIDGTTYSISEWAGGVSLADRAIAGEPIPAEEFIPNAAGLSSALAALHEEQIVHGAIDGDAILFSAAHPAKIAGFGRLPRWRTASEDVQALAALLETTLTGRPIGAALPSQVVASVTPEIDDVLELGRTGEIDALHLAGSLRSLPLLSTTRRRLAGWSWRWVTPTVALFVVAGLLVLLGSNLTNQASPLTIAVEDPAPSASTVESGDAAPVTTGAQAQPANAGVQALRASAYDPFGTDGEHNELAANAVDGNFETSWRTEEYFSPLPLLKDGVGLTVEVTGSVSNVEIAGARDGTAFELYWANTNVSSFDGWTLISQGTIRQSRAQLSVPATDDGVWLIWFTDLPATNEGTYTGSISEVRFSS